MRPLTDEETTTFFEKLAQYIGRNIKQLIDRPDEPHCFRLHKERVYYVSERVMRQATSIARDDLVALGTCFGKFTKTKKFHLKISALDHLAQYAKVRARAHEPRLPCRVGRGRRAGSRAVGQSSVVVVAGRCRRALCLAAGLVAARGAPASGGVHFRARDAV